MTAESEDNTPEIESEDSEPIRADDLSGVQLETKSRKGCCGCWWPLLIAIVVIILAWFLVSPGVFTVQPIGALPDGITIIYHSRNPEMAFFSSPDSLCLEIQGSVSLLCRAMALGSMEGLTDRIVMRLPYMEWTYLASTGGSKFDR